jgi:hypothetical protein
MEGSNDRIGATVALAVQECWYFFKSINNMQTCSTPCQTFPPTAHLAHAHTPPRFSVRVGYACAGRLGTASWQRVQCTDEPEYRDGRRRGADCAATDSSWQMEEREVCNGTTWVDLDRGVSGAAAEPLCAAGAAACLLIDVLVVRGAPLRARSLALSCRQLAQRHPSFSGDRTSFFWGWGQVPLTLQVAHKFKGAGTAADLEWVRTVKGTYLYLDKTDTLDGTYNLFKSYMVRCTRTSHALIQFRTLFSRRMLPLPSHLSSDKL